MTLPHVAQRDSESGREQVRFEGVEKEITPTRCHLRNYPAASRHTQFRYANSESSEIMELSFY